MDIVEYLATKIRFSPVLNKSIELLPSIYDSLTKYISYRGKWIEVAGKVKEFLENPATTLLSFIDATIYDIRLVAATHAYFLTASLKLVHFIVFLQPTEYVSERSLRMVTLHELVHAAGYTGEKYAEGLAEDMAKYFPHLYTLKSEMEDELRKNANKLEIIYTELNTIRKLIERKNTRIKLLRNSIKLKPVK